MKNKTLKKTLLISTGLLAAGGICIGIGIAMGGSPVFYLDNEGIHLKETTACPETVQDYAGQKQLAAFEKIEVDLKYGEFSLEEGDSYSVEYLLAGDREEPVCQVENGTLIVKEGDFGETQEGNRWYFRLWGEEGERRQDDPYVKITVPKGARLKAVSVDAPWDIDLAANLSAEKLSVKTSYGAGTQGTLDVKNSYGDTNIYGMQEADAYGYDLYTEYGKIYFSGYEMMENENGDAAEYRKQAPGSAVIRVSAENGDIKIRENVAKSTLEETVAETKSVDEEE